MNLRMLAILTLSVLASWITYAFWVISLFPDGHLLYLSAMIVGGFLFSGFAWMGYSGYLMYRVLFKIDPIVDPDAHDFISRYGDSHPYRLHRLLKYSMSAASRWANGRIHDHFNFRKLPRNLKIPLQLHFYWLLLFFGAGLSASAAFELMDYLGLPY